MERPIKELTEDEVKEYRIIKAALDAGATVKWANEGEGGFYLRGRKLSMEEAMDCIFNPDFKTTMTNADRIRSMTDEELAEWIGKVTAGGYGMCAPGHYDCIGKDSCAPCWLEWLKQEAKDG